jgi:acyl-coenzyme A synthetase/AMP-(fatty) acid ligase
LITQQPQFISLPELFRHKLDKPFCLLSSGQNISTTDFLRHALSLSQQLPAQSYAINLCQDRYLFMVAYLAVLLRQQITLLPANQAPRTIQNLLASYPQSYCLTDMKPHQHSNEFIVSWELLTQAANPELPDFKNLEGLNEKPFPLLNIHQPISISFTSGSTGEPKAIVKTWAEFQRAAELALHAVGLQNRAVTLVSTVPPQHMYGLETSLFWVLFSDLTIHNSRPFYPEDIRLTLQSLPLPALISTPTHLKSCVHSHSDWSLVTLILSSTAPLAIELAAHIEQRFNAPLLEIYGSTETLSFAVRRSHVSQLWESYQGVLLYQQAQKFFVKGGHLAHPVALDDNFDIAASGLFTNLGRATDLIKIGGKRASLTELNQILTQLPAVEDGLFFKVKNGRLAALVVSSALKSEIIAELKLAIDAVFLPRMIYQVAKLPRNDTGKIIKAELEHLIKELNCVAD